MHLAIIKGSRKGLVFPLDGRTVTIGRDRGATIPLDDTRASRNHAVVEPEGGGWVLKDLESTNHTFLNGEPVARAVLKEGDVIKVGGTEIRFQADLDQRSVSQDSSEYSLAVDPKSIQLALRNSDEHSTGRVSMSEALFQISMLADVELKPDEFLSSAAFVLGRSVDFSGWAWVDWPGGPDQRFRVRGERSGKAMAADDVAMSRTLLDRAIAMKTGLTSSELSEQFEPSKVMGLRPISSALAIPILGGDRVQSVLYLDREEDAEPFGRDELECAAVLGSLVGIHLASIVLYRKAQGAFEELRQSQNELVRSEKLAAIGRLASGFAHDLNNPLGSVLGFLDLAERALAEGAATDTEKLTQYVQKARGAADFCRALSRNLLAFAREAPFGGEGESKPFSVLETVHGTLNICNASLVKSGAQVEVQIPADLNLSGDSSTLQQVVMNLVLNAADAIAEFPSERPPRIVVAAAPADEGVLLTIADNGPGIPREIASRVFEALFTTKKGHRGTGLGLFVVRRIVEESGGNISFRSEMNAGTEFTIMLPKKLKRLGTDEFDPSMLTVGMATVHDL